MDLPRGVTDQFLRILQNERKASVRTALWMGVLSIFVYFMAELTDGPLLGFVVQVLAAAVVLGLVAGGVYAWRRTKTYNDSILASWNAWMRMSLSCARVDEVARHVKNQRAPLPIAGVGWAAIFLANVILFLALWVETSWALAFGVMVSTANGMVLGALAGQALWNIRWAAKFHRALDELLVEGRVGLWGEV